MVLGRSHLQLKFMIGQATSSCVLYFLDPMMSGRTIKLFQGIHKSKPSPVCGSLFGIALLGKIYASSRGLPLMFDNWGAGFWHCGSQMTLMNHLVHSWPSDHQNWMVGSLVLTFTNFGGAIGTIPSQLFRWVQVVSWKSDGFFGGMALVFCWSWTPRFEIIDLEPDIPADEGHKGLDDGPVSLAFKERPWEKTWLLGMTFDDFEHLEFDDGANMTWNGVEQTYSRFGWEKEHGVLLHVVCLKRSQPVHSQQSHGLASLGQEASRIPREMNTIQTTTSNVNLGWINPGS